jgi:putative transposase
VQTVGDSRERSKFLDRNSQLSLRRQCQLLHVPRSVLYYELTGESSENLRLMMEVLDRLHLEAPSAGVRRMQRYVHRMTGIQLGLKRVRRLMRLMGIEAIYPRKRTTIPGGPSGIYPYKLKNIKIDKPGQVWCADITYIPMRKGYMYLFAILDWFSRKVLAWELSTTLDTDFCLRCLDRVLKIYGKPEIWNTDQGCQFTSEKWISRLKCADVTISMDGKGRWLDNVAVKRFRRTIKYEDIYLKSYENPRELACGITPSVLISLSREKHRLKFTKARRRRPLETSPPPSPRGGMGAETNHHWD